MKVEARERERMRKKEREREKEEGNEARGERIDEGGIMAKERVRRETKRARMVKAKGRGRERVRMRIMSGRR